MGTFQLDNKVVVIVNAITQQSIAGHMEHVLIQAKIVTIKNVDIKMRLLSTTRWVVVHAFAPLKNDLPTVKTSLV